MKVVGYAYDAAIHCPDCTMNYARAVPYKDYDFQDGLYSDEDIASHNPGIIDLTKAIDLQIITDSEGNGIHPVFDTEETDSPEHCDDCHAYIDTSWTGECVNYVTEALANWLWDDSGNTEALDEWAEQLQWCNTSRVDDIVLRTYRHVRKGGFIED